MSTFAAASGASVASKHASGRLSFRQSVSVPVEKRVPTGSINPWRGRQNIKNSNGPQNLSALFAAPHDLMLIGTFEDAKRKALSQQKILLVNIQNQNDFASHCLNRDIWSDETVRQVISCSYIFWVTDINDDLGLEYVRNYNVKKCVKEFGVCSR